MNDPGADQQIKALVFEEDLGLVPSSYPVSTMWNYKRSNGLFDQVCMWFKYVPIGKTPIPIK